MDSDGDRWLHEHPKVELLRSTFVDVDAHVPLPIETDGEVAGTTPAHFEVVPGVLKLRAPQT